MVGCSYSSIAAKFVSVHLVAWFEFGDIILHMSRYEFDGANYLFKLPTLKAINSFTYDTKIYAA